MKDIPKVELHVHLEGSVRAGTAIEMSRRNGAPLPTRVPAALERALVCSSMEGFFAAFDILRELFRGPEDYHTAAAALLSELAAQNVRYVEMRIAPGNMNRKGLPVAECVRAINEACESVRAASGIRAGIVVGFSRERAETDARFAAETALECRPLGVVGFDLYGVEKARDPRVNREVMSILGGALPVTAHAGEWDGPDSVREALDTLNPARIGHGARAVEDPALLERLLREKIHIETCPKSNLLTGVVPRIEDHPVRRFFDLGIPISINTDDPGVFGNTITSELELVRDTFGFTPAELRKIMLDSAAAAFTTENIGMESEPHARV